MPEQVKQISPTLLVLIGSSSGDTVCEQGGSTLVHVELNISLGSKRGVGSHGNTDSLAVIYQRLLGQVGVQFDLVDLRLNAGIAQDIREEGTSDVAVQGQVISSRYQNGIVCAHLTPMFLTSPLSTSFSMDSQVS